MSWLEKGSSGQLPPQVSVGHPGAQGTGGALGPEAGEGSLGASGGLLAVQLLEKGLPGGSAGVSAGSEKPVFKDCCGLGGITTDAHPLCHVGALAQA